MKDNLQIQDSLMFGKKNIEKSIAALYHENSKFTKFSVLEDFERVHLFYDEELMKRYTQPYKLYPKAPILKLPIPETINGLDDLISIIKKRKSKRNFDLNKTLSYKELATILHYSYGIMRKEKVINSSDDIYLSCRPVPSAGGLYPLEIYFVSLNCEINKGLYHFRSDISCLEMIKNGDFEKTMDDILLAKPNVNIHNSSGIIIITHILERTIIKYGELGYRFILLESGSVSQMLSLVATSLNIGTCIIGAYYDNDLSDFLDIDGVFESVNNVIVIGKN